MVEQNALEARLAALEQAFQGLVHALEQCGIVLPQESHAEPLVQPQCDDTAPLPQSPFEAVPGWEYNSDTELYEYKSSTKQCPAEGGEMHITLRHGYKITKYKDINGGIIKVRVKRYYCKTCQNTYLQRLMGVHCHHRITLRLFNAVITAAKDHTLYGTLAHGKKKELSELFGLDMKVIGSIIYKYRLKAQCSKTCLSIDICGSYTSMYRPIFKYKPKRPNGRTE